MQPQLQKFIEQKTKQQFPNGISSYGTDALRFTFAAIATHNRHIKFELLRLEGSRNFCNKLWNAARFVLFHIKDQQFDLFKLSEVPTNIADTWILSIWQQYKRNIIEHINHYRFDLASKDIYEFVWNEYCDWYLESAKTTIEHNITKAVLILILSEIIRVLHPIMPYITEEIWQALGSKEILINLSYPQYQEQFVDDNTEHCMALVKKCVMAVRNIRGTMNISPAIILPKVFINNNAENLLDHQTLIKSLAKIKDIEINDQPKNKGAATAVFSKTEIWVPLQGLIDNQTEIDRLNREINKLEKQLVVTINKLNNVEYLNNAPLTIVTKEQQKRLELQNNIDKLKASLQLILDV